jgi:hypothetical protein
MGRGIREPSNDKSKIQQTQGRTVRDFTDSLVSSGTDTPLLPGVTLQNKAMEMARQFVRGNRAFSFWRQSRWGGAVISEDFRFPGLAEPGVGK